VVPRGVEEGPKSDLQPQVERKNAPRRAQDRLGPAKRAIRRLFPHPEGSIWAFQNDPKRSRKRSKIEAKIESRKKAIHDDQGPVLERSWSLWGRHVGARRPQKYWKTYYFVQIRFFEDKTVRRGSWDQLRPTKAPKGAKMTPKRDPRSTPKRPKTDIKIDLNFDAKTKRACHGSARRLWAGTPPQGGAPAALGRGPSGTGAAPRHPCARYTCIHYTLYSIQGT
jgi:hypothetical protein